MQVYELLQQRKQRGYEIAKANKVIQKDGNWFVSSQSSQEIHIG